MNTCESCAHWSAPSERDDVGDSIRIDPPKGRYTPEDFAAARQAQHAADLLFGRCGAIYLRTVELGEPLPLAVAMDGSEYMANLYTQAGFGCAMWEERQRHRAGWGAG